MKMSGSIFANLLFELQENIYGENFSLFSYCWVCCWFFFVCLFHFVFGLIFYYALICKKYATELH